MSTHQNNPQFLKHRTLTEKEKSDFIDLYKYVEQQYPFFRLMKRSNNTMIAWSLYVFLFVIACGVFAWIKEYAWWRIAISFSLGILSLQIIFVTSHVKSHALFLEYENHALIPVSPKSDNSMIIVRLINELMKFVVFHCDKYLMRCINAVVYYYAFYHHHHFEKNNQKNWFKELSYYTDDGIRNIISAHWHSYTFIGSIHLVLIVLASYFSPKVPLVFAGYEVGVWLLPLAHGWQHINHDKFGFMKYFFVVLEQIGMFAGGDDHTEHHKHDHDTVFQGFSSSGLYMKWIDMLIDYLWNIIYYESIQKGIYPYDKLSRIADLIQNILLFFIGCILYAI